MSDRIQLLRRAKSTGSSSWFLLPRPPSMPSSLATRFPELNTYNAEQQRWWEQFMANLHGALLGTGGTPTSGSTAATLTPEMLAQVNQLIRDNTATVTAVISRARYVHHQDVPASEWPINHDLDGYPIHMVVLSSGQVGYGDVYHINQQQSVIRLGGAVSGKAYLLS